MRGRGSLRVLALVMVAGVGTAVLAPPYVQGAVTRFKADLAAEEVVEALAEARDLAARREQPVRVFIDERQRAVAVEGGRWRKLADGVTLGGPRRGPDGRAAILFLPDGTSSGGQVVLSTRESAWALSVDQATGQVRKRHGR